MAERQSNTFKWINQLPITCVISNPEHQRSVMNILRKLKWHPDLYIQNRLMGVISKFLIVDNLCILTYFFIHTHTCFVIYTKIHTIIQMHFPITYNIYKVHNKVSVYSQNASRKEAAKSWKR